jgi:hypothetical protein
MTPLTMVKLAAAAAAFVLWGIGVRTGDSRFTWAGIALLAVAFLFRFLNRRDDGEPSA